MGILKFFAKHGNVGKTTNWTAKTYLKLKGMYPEKEDKEILEAMIKLRYSVWPIKDSKKDALIKDIQKMESLGDFVFSLLGAETGLFKIRDPKYIQETFEIIEAELAKYNIKPNLK